MRRIWENLGDWGSVLITCLKHRLIFPRILTGQAEYFVIVSVEWLPCRCAKNLGEQLIWEKVVAAQNVLRA